MKSDNLCLIVPRLLLLLVLISVFAGCGAKDSEDSNDNGLVYITSYAPQQAASSISSGSKPDEFVNAFNNLAFEILKTESPDAPGNSVSGPYSFFQVLGMTVKGAKTETLEEIRQAFFFGRDADDWINSLYNLEKMVNQSGLNLFSVRNMVWGQTNYLFSREYLDELTKYDAPELVSMDFLNLGSIYQSQIDKWFADSTSNRIAYTGLYTDMPQRTRLVIGNLTWLENGWSDPANIQSFEGIFEKIAGEQFRVPMLRFKGKFNFYHNETMTAFELPIQSSGKSMTIFMPAESNFNSFLEKVKDRVTAISGLLTPQDVEVVIPEFNIYSANNLAGFMKSTGINLAFDEKKSDFSAVNGLGYLYLKDVKGNARIGVSKESIYVGSATATMIEATPDEPKDVWSGESGSHDVTITTGCPMVYQKAGTADARPFVFVIRDTATNAILYIGRLIDAGGKEAGKWVCSWDIPPVIEIVNTAPEANAGSDQQVMAGDTVVLNGSGSYDADNDVLTYKWSVVSKPTGSQAVLSDSKAASPTFVADVVDGVYVVQLIVNDGKVDSSPVTVNITTLNPAP